jgi:hypothetical protein
MRTLDPQQLRVDGWEKLALNQSNSRLTPPPD